MSPRARTPGSLVLRKGTTDQWRLRVSLGRDDGASYRVVERAFKGTEPQAQAALAKFFAEVEGKKLSRNKTTLGKLAQEVVDNKRRRGRAPKTVDDYQRMADWLEENYGNVEVSKIGTKWIDNVIDRIQDEKGQSAAQHYYVFIRLCLNSAERWDLIDRSPTRKMEGVPEPKPDTRTPEPQEVRALIDAAEKGVPERAADPSMAAAIFISATRALGPAELAGLRDGDVDLARGQIAVRTNISHVRGEKHIRETKTKARTAPVALDEASAEVLRRQLERVAEECRLSGVKLDGSRFLWSLEPDHSTPVAPGYFSYRFGKFRDALGIKKVRFYDLRHYAATQAIEAGVNVKVAQALMRHSTVQMTLDRYASVIQAQGIEVARLLSATLTE